MKILIDKYGSLSIERKRGMVLQYCPYSKNRCCGDECPMFGEPTQLWADRPTNRYELQLCHITLTFLKDDLIDKRKVRKD